MLGKKSLLVLVALLALAGAANAAALFLYNTTVDLSINGTNARQFLNQSSPAASATTARLEYSTVGSINRTFYEFPYNASFRNFSGNINAFICLNGSTTTGNNGIRAWLYNVSTFTGEETKLGQSAYQDEATTAACVARQLNLVNISGSNFLPDGSILKLIIRQESSANGRISKIWFNTSSAQRLMGNLTIGNLSFVGDLAEPNYSDSHVNTTSTGALAKFAVRWTENNQLWGSVFEYDDGSGTFVNDSLVNVYSMNNWTNTTKELTATLGATIRWRYYVNDTRGNMNVTPIYTFTTSDPYGFACETLRYRGAQDGWKSLYRLNQTLFAPAGCITIGSPNITLDCNGFPVYYAQSSAGLGLNLSTVGLDNLTIQNCNFFQNSSSMNSTAVYINGTFANPATNITITNSTFWTNGSLSRAIELTRVYNASLYNVVARTNGTPADAMRIHYGLDINISACIILANGSDAEGINLSRSNFTLINSTIIQTNGSSANALYIENSVNTTIIFSTVQTNGSNSSAVYATLTAFINFTHSNFTTLGTTSDGITIVRSRNLTSLGSTFNATRGATGGFTRSYGAYLYATNDSNFTESVFFGSAANFNSSNSINNSIFGGRFPQCVVLCESNYTNVALERNSSLEIIGTSMTPYNVSFINGFRNNVTMRWFVRVNVSFTNGTPVVGTLVNISNDTSSLNPMYQNLLVDDTGVTEWVMVTDFIGNRTANQTFSPFNVTIVNYTQTRTGNFSINQTMTINFTFSPDIVAPNFSKNMTNGTRAAKNSTMSVHWSDNFNLSYFIFSFDNGSGIFVNDSQRSFSETLNWSNVTKFINTTGGSLIRWQVYGVDIYDNMNATPIYFFSSSNPVGGTSNYSALGGFVFTVVTKNGASLLSGMNSRLKNGTTIYVNRNGATITWSRIRVPSLGTDLPNMNAFFGLTGLHQLNFNYNDTTRNICNQNSVNVMNMTTPDTYAGVIYSDEDNSASYTSGDTIIFCTDVNYNVLNYNGSRVDYQLTFPTSIGQYDMYVEAG